MTGSQLGVDILLDQLDRLDLDTSLMRRRLTGNRRDGKRDRLGLRLPVQRAMVEARRQHRNEMIWLRVFLREHGIVARLDDLRARCPEQIDYWIAVHQLKGKLERGAYVMMQDGSYRLFPD